MLVLTRRMGQSIQLSGDIVITICGIKGNQVSVGISAPRNIAILRTELKKIPKKPKELVVS